MKPPALYSNANPAHVERWINWLLSSEAVGVLELGEILVLERVLG